MSSHANSKPPARRIGVIGDLHGEDQRLAEVLDWFAGQQLDAVLCTGDIADGRGCINRCCELLQQARVQTVAGNHDRWLLQDRVRHVANAHQLADLTAASLEYLQALPRSLTLATVAGELLLCHGVADNDLCKVWPGTRNGPIERSHELDGLLAESRYRFLVNGHLHYRVLIDFDDLVLINAGTLRGEYSGVSIIDFDQDSVSSFEVKRACGQRVAEHRLSHRPTRRVWRDTQEFDGTWQPAMLYSRVPGA